MNEMILRGAKAIRAKVPEGYGMTGEEAAAYARAFIEAMSKPTAAMIKAGWQDGNAGYGEGEEMEPIWRAMIKAALE